MNLTPYHAKYYAHELTRRCPSDSIEKLAGALVDAQVDLNPHQVDAALFAFRSPLSKGTILADEVGLGKTIFEFFRGYLPGIGGDGSPTQHQAAGAFRRAGQHRRSAGTADRRN